MFQNNRNTKVFATAVVSILIGGLILKSLGHNPLPAGAFSLSDYYHLVPVEKVISSDITGANCHWDCIEVHYSDSKAGNIKQPDSVNSPLDLGDINCHFVIYNGAGAGDGQIQATENWQRQQPVGPARTIYGSTQTIHICVIADGRNSVPTDFQIKRTESLVESLYREFDIEPALIYYPDNWR